MGERLREVGVLGGGVMGLTCARRLQEAGHAVRLVAEEVGLETTSAQAAVVWLPFKAEPRRRIGEWAHRTYRVCRDLAGVEAAGVRFVPLQRFSRRPLIEPFWLRPEIPFRHLDPGELPPGYDHGWEAEVPFFHARRFLAWLLEEFQAAGGELVRRRVGSLGEVAEACGLGSDGAVVHCAGLGARETVDDRTVYPIRGHTVVVRPGRKEVRLETEPAAAGGRPVVHSYGHGGSGFTVCWGCADEVAQRVRDL